MKIYPLAIINWREVNKMEEKIAELTKAKEAVIWLLSNDGLVDMHGITYWSGEVERLRRGIKEVI
jgi:hypothetical protein